MFSNRLFHACSSVAKAVSARPTFIYASTFRAMGTQPPSRIQDELAVLQKHTENAKSSSLGIEDLWRHQSSDALEDAKRFPPAHAYSGRSVPVHSGKVAEAIRSLDGILGRNRFRYQLRLQERHEKRGEKLRRLRSERWRKQFAAEVRKKVQLVTKIRNRGA
ncbi:hypothetical protein EST38_g1713 [Candolleomyces aberdarensis]|uniref:Uncharacterized protein n=1 Tax=Candolleomyces aberdarensis TaxID=2316362 RepID=A0A4Q2DYM0_9AGAR|nr:hypothetical protein EST38_g1713 [Candolleomyces aberdarensis]